GLRGDCEGGSGLATPRREIVATALGARIKVRQGSALSEWAERFPSTPSWAESSWPSRFHGSPPRLTSSPPVGALWQYSISHPAGNEVTHHLAIVEVMREAKIDVAGGVECRQLLG